MLPVIPVHNLAESYDLLLCFFSMLAAVVSYVLSCR